MKITLYTTIIFFTVGMIANTNSFSQDKSETAEAVFAGGCFWCMESDFEKIDGVKDVISGYINGTGENPTYRDYADRGFIEVVLVKFDAAKISYNDLLTYYWRHVDPTDAGGQFCDRGHAYTTGIFYLSDEQKKSAAKSKEALEKSGVLQAPIVTPITVAGKFYPAEDYHQNYYKKNPLKYKFYRYRCGRDKRIEEVWVKEEGGID
ncbi:peptide-methionine (S)-S-oxide reductase MsrA [uncultured Desulfosarcina sp.]|uniref:peptide-methionine (S)-S-oxide reductase MsrA n=1 Tax=uncultured Desulfosarcina sp. TaxID=218289 RepID=UPI0029C62393|nr:peptide-methionine (S)-S-oxide reductase MsrA [uncultured Desulfosarcina sp.]